MSISCPNFASQILRSHASLIARKNIHAPQDVGIFPSPFHANLRPTLSNYPSVFPSSCNCNQTFSSTTEDYYRNSALEFDDMDLGKYSKELEVAVKAVQMASLLCQRVQESLLSRSNDHVQSKDDNSPVTVAGNSLANRSVFLCFY
ncbi:hypothetical protein Sango_1385600 [Sesamum angolense]|uniref:Uncharacterized protein n=1 Tax=Sesamum angolense TaxID=2727404 RepID=A0AAE1WTB5_9LAMI|nr:hypothetical protein Sango_1385600 [Sesamum angolense]